MMSYDVQDIITPIKFWVTPVRGYPVTPEVAAVLKAEARLQELASNQLCQVTSKNFINLKPGKLIGVTVSFNFCLLPTTKDLVVT
jgi:hypothetical protein